MMGLKFQVWTYLPCEACTITVIIKINMIVILKLIIIILMIESFIKRWLKSLTKVVFNRAHTGHCKCEN